MGTNDSLSPKPESNDRGTDDDEAIYEDLKFGYLCPNCGSNRFHLHKTGNASCGRCGLVHLHNNHFGWVPLVEDKNLGKSPEP